MLGKSYVIAHCITYLKKESEQTALRVYITDALRAVVGNTAKFSGGVVMKRRFADIINNVDDEESKEQAQERAKGIIGNIKNKLKALGKEDACDKPGNDIVRKTDS